VKEFSKSIKSWWSYRNTCFLYLLHVL